ncbi:MAG: hypothetical protein J7L23_04850 [Candidatus Diapherotrites archaeon]|nr:hypothetical protein [Candidatus Diapherotrites archaeon]
MSKKPKNISELVHESIEVRKGLTSGNHLSYVVVKKEPEGFLKGIENKELERQVANYIKEKKLGQVDIEFRRVKELVKAPNPNKRLTPSEVRRLGLNEGDLVAEITDFFPLHDVPNEYYHRHFEHGMHVGDKVLDKILTNLKEKHKIKAVFADTRMEKMQGLLESRGFKRGRKGTEREHVFVRRL